MKYIILPILRLLMLIYLLFCFPIIVAGEGALSLWHWDLKHLRGIKEWLTESFLEQNQFNREGFYYFYYKNPWHYLIGKKSWKYWGETINHK